MTNQVGPDLRFIPVTTADPRRLTQEQIATYNTQGYLMPFDVFPAEEAQRNRLYFDELLTQVRTMDDGRDAYSINGYQSRCQGIYDIATDARILDIVADLVGPDVICWATHFFCKEPGDPKAVPWHQDASYWPLTPARTVTVWLAIDDVGTDNAPMQVIPGTHAMGHLPWVETKQDAVLGQEVCAVEALGDPVAVTLRAGQIELHADMLVHGSEPNQSTRRRCGLTLRYCPPTVRPLKSGWGSNAILCRGKDRTGHWRYCDRPRGEDLTRGTRPPQIGGN